MYNDSGMKKKNDFFCISKCTIIIFIAAVLFSFSKCNSTDAGKKNKTDAIKRPTIAATEITLTFSGDIMAHDVNFNMKNYDRIYGDVKELLTRDDLTFGNIETPVCNELPLSSYPSFNVHEDYLKAAIDGGFDVFAFANNHTNDKGVRGIDGTIKSFLNLKAEYKMQNKDIFSSGLKEKAGDDFQPVLIEKNGWRILFLSVTELLNSYGPSKERLYYSNPSVDGRERLLQAIKRMRTQIPCDIFVLALHLFEPEYGLKITKEKQEWFKHLAANGVDIVWAHHPHVLQDWEIAEVDNTGYQIIVNQDGIENKDGKPSPIAESEKYYKKKAVFLYSMGNFISGQRWAVNYANPDYYREYTGDSILMQIHVKKTDSGSADYFLKPVLITNYNEENAPIVKIFTKEWAENLTGKEKTYFLKRFELMKSYLPQL